MISLLYIYVGKRLKKEREKKRSYIYIINEKKICV